MDRKFKVIIADDMKQIAETYKNIAICNENIEVVAIADNGKEELDLILKLKPDLVITDNKMPEMNGIEVIEKISQLEIDDKPEFILVTGDCNWELNNKCRELDVFRIINKLSVNDALLDTIEEYISFKTNLNIKEVDTFKKTNKDKNEKRHI